MANYALVAGVGLANSAVGSFLTALGLVLPSSQPRQLFSSAVRHWFGRGISIPRSWSIPKTRATDARGPQDRCQH